MPKPGRNEAGDTLVEILVSIVIIGIVVGAFLAAIATTSVGSASHRDLATADGMLRDSAELLKSAVRVSCTSATSTYDVSFSTKLQSHVSFTPPPDITNRHCPPVAGPIAGQVPIVRLTVVLPRGNTKSLDVIVRTPGNA